MIKNDSTSLNPSGKNTIYVNLEYDFWSLAVKFY